MLHLGRSFGMVGAMAENEDDLRIRPAVVADAPRIAQVHIASWQEAYSGIVPAQVLDNLDLARREEQWRAALENAERDGVRAWVAETGDRLVGFCSLGPSRDEDADRRTWEIYSIYLEPDTWGRGVARELMRTMLAEVPADAPVTLWVLADNERARHFYRRHGFQPDGTERLEPFGEAQLLEVRYRRG